MYKIAVLGCGVIGLNTALAIQEDLKSLAKVTIYTENVTPNTTGDVSAGLWSPHLLHDTNIDDIIKWSKATQDRCIDLWRKGYADEVGICLQAVTTVSQQDDFKYPEWASVPLSCHKISLEYLARLNRQYKKNYKTGFVFITVSCEPSKLLPFLQKRFLKNGGTIKMMKITDFSQVADYDIVVNCTGLYSKILAKDDQVMAIRGQVTRVRAPWHYHSFVDEDEDNYIVANYDTVVLGGTHQVDDYNKNPDESDTQTILNGCYKLTPALKNAPIIKHMVGLRPGRTQVRLDLEVRNIITKDKSLKIVHNYGHGGAGVTLSYGCALEAAQLVRNALNIRASKL